MSALAAIFVCAQWWEMHKGGIDTHDLAVAAKDQAATAKSQAEELKKQAADTHDLAIQAKNQADRTKDLVDQMKAQAIETTTIAKTAEEQLTAFKDVQAARLSIEDLQVSTDGTQLSYVLVNRGNSIALDISEGGRGGEFKNWDDPKAQIAQFDKEMAPPPNNGYTLAQGDRQSRVLTIPPKKDWWSYNAFFYQDIFGRENEALYCWFRRRPFFRAGFRCPQNVTANEKANKGNPN
jgi:hypothetical protein